MAYFFEAFLEFEKQEDATIAARRWNSLAFRLTDGFQCEVFTQVSQNPDTAEQNGPTGWYLCIYTPEITRSGLNSPAEEQRANEFTNIFFGLLKNEKLCRFAAIGVECGFCRSYEEIVKEMKDHWSFWPGLVVSELLWREGGCPKNFVPFATSLFWIPWKEGDYT